VFTNGQLDPWRAGGVIVNDPSLLPPSVVSLVIADGQQPPGRCSLTVPHACAGAHHLDLMFANELDPPSVRAARQLQLQVPSPPNPHLLPLTSPQHITSWLAPSSPTSSPALQCPDAAVWPWIVGALVVLQLCSLVLFGRHAKAARHRNAADDGRTPLLM
jgi:hypothetical protein